MSYPNKETELVRKTAGKGRAIDGLLQARRGNKKYSNYAIYLLDNDQTVYVNLDTMEAHVSEEPNKRMIKEFRQKEERRLERQQRKADREQEKAERAAKPKAEPKPKAVKTSKPKKAEPTGQMGWSDSEWARIQAIMAEKKCTRKNAIRAFQKERLHAKLESKQAPVDPLKAATPVYA